jgi:hypothetical protein
MGRDAAFACLDLSDRLAGAVCTSDCSTFSLVEGHYVLKQRIKGLQNKGLVVGIQSEILFHAVVAPSISGLDQRPPSSTHPLSSIQACLGT